MKKIISFYVNTDFKYYRRDISGYAFSTSRNFSIKITSKTLQEAFTIFNSQIDYSCHYFIERRNNNELIDFLTDASY
jgi:hypothetical protein